MASHGDTCVETAVGGVTDGVGAVTDRISELEMQENDAEDTVDPWQVCITVNTF